MSEDIKNLNELTDSRILYEKKLPRFGYVLLCVMTVLFIGVICWSIVTPKNYIVKASGTIQSDNKNYVMSEYMGEIIDLNIEEGLLVEKGDYLFSVKGNEINAQLTQLLEQEKKYHKQVDQYKKLIESIKDDTNYFDPENEEEGLYYSQYEAYKSQIRQNDIDTTMYKNYGYSEEQIKKLIKTNEAKISELYYGAIQSSEKALAEVDSQIESIAIQKQTLADGIKEYNVYAQETGLIHMLSEYKEGMVLQAATPIASIASDRDVYVIIVYIPAQDMVKINVGDQVDVAISGLPQSIYGTIEGKVRKIDSDITTSSSSGGEQVSFFKAYIEPNSNYLISKEGNKINISNGMQVEARILYDEMTYFNYLLEELGGISR